MPRRAPSYKIQKGKLVDFLSERHLKQVEDAFRVVAQRHFIPAERRDAALGMVMSYNVVINPRMGSYGWCMYGTRTIELAGFLFPEHAEQEDTLLHEIAHAMSYHLLAYDGHGKPWKECAAEVGAAPVRCGPSIAVTDSPVKSRWLYKCTSCDKQVHRSRRFQNTDVPGQKTRVSCGRCSPGVFNPKFAFVMVR